MLIRTLTQQRQRFKNLVYLGAPPIEKRIFGFAEGLATRFTPIALPLLSRLAKFLDGADRVLHRQLPIVLIGGIGTEITDASGF